MRGAGVESSLELELREAPFVCGAAEGCLFLFGGGDGGGGGGRFRERERVFFLFLFPNEEYSHSLS